MDRRMGRNPVEEKELIKSQPKADLHFHRKLYEGSLAERVQVMVQKPLLAGTTIDQFPQKGFVFGPEALGVGQHIRDLGPLFNGIKGPGGFQAGG